MTKRKQAALLLCGFHLGFLLLMAFVLGTAIVVKYTEEGVHFGSTYGQASIAALGLGLLWFGVPAVIHTGLLWRVLPQNGGWKGRLFAIVTGIGVFAAMRPLVISGLPAAGISSLVASGALWGAITYNPARWRSIDWIAVESHGRSNGG